MIDEKKERKKAEKDRREKEAQSKHQGDGLLENHGPAETSSHTEETHVHDDHGNGDDETIDQDDGYDIQNGDLMKDGVVLASGAVFESGISPEDEHQVEGSTGDMVNGNGEDVMMMMDDTSHILADGAAMDSDMMLWER